MDFNPNKIRRWGQYSNCQNFDTMNKKELKDNTLLKNNPLISQDFKIVVNKLTDKKSLVYSDGAYLMKEFYFEVTPMTKIFKTPLHRRLIGLLSDNAKCLLYWIFFEIQPNEDFVLINKTRYLKENNIKSLNTYKKAINELHAELVICPSPVKDVYFINPRLFFCGNRVKTYPNAVITYDKHRKQQKKE